MVKGTGFEELGGKLEGLGEIIKEGCSDAQEVKKVQKFLDRKKKKKEKTDVGGGKGKKLSQKKIKKG